MIDKQIDKNSLDITKLEMQKIITKQLYEKSDIGLNQYNLIVSKLDKKIQSICKKKREGLVDDLNSIVLDIKM